MYLIIKRKQLLNQKMSEDTVRLVGYLKETPYYKEFIKTLPADEVVSFNNRLKENLEFVFSSLAENKNLAGFLDEIKAVQELHPEDKEFVQDYNDFIAGVGDREAIHKRIVDKLTSVYKEETLLSTLHL